VPKNSRSLYPAILSFTGALLLFGALNLWTLISVPGCCDQIDVAGFPFHFFESGGFAEIANFYSLPLIADIVIGLLAAAASGFVVWRLTGSAD
jgi:hypothetical protein